METKTLKIEIPDGYEIDKEKSTFENIVFKKVDDVEIKWNKRYFGVEIKANGEHFILEGNPDYYMTWNEAIRFYDNLQFWKLPTTKQLQVVYKYFDKINEVIKDNGGFVLCKSHYWVMMKKRSKSCAYYISMNNGYVGNDFVTYKFFARAVSSL